MPLPVNSKNSSAEEVLADLAVSLLCHGGSWCMKSGWKYVLLLDPQVRT